MIEFNRYNPPYYQPNILGGMRVRRIRNYISIDSNYLIETEFTDGIDIYYMLLTDQASSTLDPDSLCPIYSYNILLVNRYEWMPLTYNWNVRINALDPKDPSKISRLNTVTNILLPDLLHRPLKSLYDSRPLITPDPSLILEYINVFKDQPNPIIKPPDNQSPTIPDYIADKPKPDPPLFGEPDRVIIIN